MDDVLVDIRYNESCAVLENILSAVNRPGSFYCHDHKTVYMPNIEITSVGTLAFPLQAFQIKQMIDLAERAPYGKGDQTLVDTSVRKVWQIAPEHIAIGGKSWQKTFDIILNQVKTDLGCLDYPVEAELYKMLIYDEGSFFLPHRDTEKVKGMFGTLVIVLPSQHQGGELIIRHGHEEVNLSLQAEEASDIAFAAFYADCEHEVKPILSGNRICLVYNLIHRPKKSKAYLEQPEAPTYSKQIDAVASLFESGLKKDDSPAKLVWILEHQYSTSGLLFSGLKNGDAAIAKVLLHAAQKAECDISLAILHIEICGGAEPEYNYSKHHRYGRDYDEDDEEDYEILEIENREYYIADWIGVDDQPLSMDHIPLGDDELLPVGCIDDEEPDEKKLYEATGNGGATFEQAYRRAALVIWSRDRYPELLMQVGVKAVLPYLKKEMELSDDEDKMRKLYYLASEVIRRWGSENREENETLLGLLIELKSQDLLEAFVQAIATDHYTGKESASLVKALEQMNGDKVSQALQLLVENFFCLKPESITTMLQLALKLSPDKEMMSKTLSLAISKFKDLKNAYLGYGRQTKIPSNEMLVAFWGILWQCNLPELLSEMATEICTLQTFSPRECLVPALLALKTRYGKAIADDINFLMIWNLAAEKLLDQSEFPPKEPSDWRQSFKTKCTCADCKELRVFVESPVSVTMRFRAAENQRRHIQAEASRLDMDFDTEETGRPYTLVCTKNRRTYNNQRSEYLQDVKSLKILASLQTQGQAADIQLRVSEAIERAF